MTVKLRRNVLLVAMILCICSVWVARNWLVATGAIPELMIPLLVIVGGGVPLAMLLVVVLTPIDPPDRRTQEPPLH